MFSSSKSRARRGAACLAAVVLVVLTVACRPIPETGLYSTQQYTDAQLISHTLSMYVQVYVSPERLFHVYLLAIVLFAIAVFPLTSILALTGTALAQLLFSLALTYFCHAALRRAGAA